MRIFTLSKTIVTSLLFTLTTYSMEPEQHHPTLKEKIAADLQHAKEDLSNIAGNIFPALGQGKKLAAIKNNPYKDTDAFVRQGNDLSEEEKAYLIKRLPIAKAALEKLLELQLKDEEMPTIAIVNSGGGYRALLCSLGFVHGIKKIKLLDAVTYLTALSGSTGVAAPWISTKLPLKLFKEYILDRVQKPFTHPTDEEELLIFEAGSVKSFFDQPKTPVDPYGDLLGNILLESFGKERHNTYLYQQAPIVETGAYPYPIYVAVNADENIIENPNWYEFTPHEIGSAADETYIKAWADGRIFENGKSVKPECGVYPPAKNLSYFLGTCWSAFGANDRLIKEEVAKRFSGNVSEFIRHFAPSFDGDRPLGFYAEVSNYMKNMHGLKNSESAHPQLMRRVDAGTDFNLPLPPVDGSRRKADVIIICDASADTIGEQLQKTDAYMKRNNRPFPTIDYTDIDKKTISIFKENDPAVPTVIYMPRISDQDLLKQHLSDPQFARYEHLVGFDLEYETNHGFAQTIHFQYKKADALRVIDQMEFNVRVNQAAIMQALKFAIEKKKE